MGMCERDIKDAYTKSSSQRLWRHSFPARQIKTMYYSDDLVLWKLHHKFLCFRLFGVNEAEFNLWAVSPEGHALCGGRGREIILV